uniref:Uncharacterized protein n=1 Tax=viral metagenome TaxID=1070528 RepID=A0A6C0I0W8_9ZZZZ
MNIFERKQNIAAIRAIPEEVLEQIINSIHKQIYDIGHLIEDGNRMAENEWPAFMGMQRFVLEELYAKRIEYTTFLRETIAILYSGNSGNSGNINHTNYLRAFNNFMVQIQDDIDNPITRDNIARVDAFAKNREYGKIRENARIRNMNNSLPKSEIIANAKLRLRNAIARDAQAAFDAGLVKS